MYPRNGRGGGGGRRKSGGMAQFFEYGELLSY
jgi:hypothetical protein